MLANFLEKEYTFMVSHFPAVRHDYARQAQIFDSKLKISAQGAQNVKRKW